MAEDSRMGLGVHRLDYPRILGLKGTKHMRRLLAICGLLAVSSALAVAKDYTGKLLDSACYEQQKSTRGCDATSATNTFAIEVSGKVYNLDSAGNSKAAQAFKGRADRSADP